MELAAQHAKPGNHGIADTAFTVGIMSLMGVVTGMPMQDILRCVPVTDDIREALLARRGYFGELLSLAEYTEWEHKNDTVLLHILHNLHLTCRELYMLQLAAFEWSDHVSDLQIVT
jgi:EAL and modified HD-GYP domain-containing signal transduction protein